MFLITHLSRMSTQHWWDESAKNFYSHMLLEFLVKARNAHPMVFISVWGGGAALPNHTHTIVR